MLKINTLAQIFSCFFLCGLIWTIQIVHYPAFSFPKERFLEFHSFHSSRITWIVGPLMLLELVSALYLWVHTPSSKILILNVVSVVLIWGSTALLSIPYHNQLSVQFSDKAIYGLVLTNWVRTFLWTVRSTGWLYFLGINL